MLVDTFPDHPHKVKHFVEALENVAAHIFMDGGLTSILNIAQFVSISSERFHTCSIEKETAASDPL